MREVALIDGSKLNEDQARRCPNALFGHQYIYHSASKIYHCSLCGFAIRKEHLKALTDGIDSEVK